MATASRRSPLVVVRLRDVGVLIHLDGGVSSWKVLHGASSGGKALRTATVPQHPTLATAPTCERKRLTSQNSIDTHVQHATCAPLDVQMEIGRTNRAVSSKDPLVMPSRVHATCLRVPAPTPTPLTPHPSPILRGPISTPCLGG
jgi:hypothetical protein